MSNRSKMKSRIAALARWRRQNAIPWLTVAGIATISDSISATAVGALNLDAVIVLDFITLLLLALVARRLRGARSLLVWLTIVGFAMVAAFAILSALLGVGEVEIYWAQVVFGVVTLWAVMAPAVTSHLSKRRSIAV